MAIVLSEMSRHEVEALSRRLGEPDWMRDFRVRAWDLATAMDLPKRTDEGWRRTDISQLDLDRLSPEPAAAPAEVPAEWQAVVQDESQAVLVLRNGAPVFRRVPAALEQKGVIISDLETAVREHPEKVREHFMTAVVRPDESKFMALHAALWRGGTFIYVPRGVEVEGTVSVLNWADGPGAGFLGHTLLVAEPGSAVTVVEQLQSPDLDDQAVHTGAVEIWAKQSASVRYAAVQNWGDGVWSFTVRRAFVGRDSKVDWLAADFGGELVRSENYSWCHEPGGEAEFKLVFLGNGRQHLDVTGAGQHPAGQTLSNVIGRGVVAGKSRAVYRGIGHIMRGATGAACYQRENTLMLDKGARADSIPSLYIDHDDVRAGHAATTGQVDREQVFYLMSRGLSERQAKLLIVKGFLAPVLERVTLPELRAALDQLIDRKLGA